MKKILNTESRELRFEPKHTPSQGFERLCARYKAKQTGLQEFKIGLQLLHYSVDNVITRNAIDELAKELRDEQ